MSSFPRQVAGRVTQETSDQIDQAITSAGVTEGALVRMALEDYMPRYLANAGRPQHAELFAKLATAIEERPDLALELQQIAKKSTRRRRAQPSLT